MTHATTAPRSSPRSAPPRSDPAVLERMFARRRRRRAPQFLARHRRRSPRSAPSWCARPAARLGRAVGDHGRPAGPEDPRRQVQGRQGRRSKPGRRSSSTPTASWATRRASGLDYKELPRDVAPGDVLLLDDGQIVLDVTRVTGSEIHTVVAPRRRALEQQGHQPPGRRPHRAGAHAQGHRRHPHRGEDQGRLPRGVVPEERRRHVHGARAAARRRRQRAADRQDRARRGDPRARRHHGRLRRHHGRARRPRGGSRRRRGARRCRSG